MIRKKNNIKTIIIVIAVLILMGLIIFFVGRSYGFFQYVKKGETTNVVSIKGIRINVIEDDNALNLENAEPLYDKDGMELKAFTFSITNTSSRALTYTLKVANDTDKQNTCLINEGTEEETTCPVLSIDNIRFSYKLNDENWSEPANLGDNNNAIHTYTINGKETLTYSIKIWIKSDATNAIMNHYFFGQLLIQGAEAAQEMYRPYDVATILSNFNQEDLKEVVACDNDNRYTNCSIYNTIEDAISAKNKSVIVLTSDIDRTTLIDIPADKDITLDLNGKKIETTNPDNLDETNTTWNKNYAALDVYGNLIINDDDNTGEVVANIQAPAIYVEVGGTAIINGGTYNGRNSVQNYGKSIEINNGTFNSKINSTIYSNSDSSNTIINNGIFNSPNTATLVAADKGNIDINGGIFNAAAMVIKNNSSTGTTNITGGTFTSNSSNAITNTSTGTINIIQTDNPIYITSLAQELKPVIVNSSTGIINITANQANKCTSNASDTTSGLCVYAEGNVNATDNDRNVAVQNKSSGTININGGTYYGGSQGLNNNYSSEPYGIINIKNAKIISDRGVVNTYGGTINICNCIFDNIRYNIYNYSTGTINYNNVTFSNGTTTPVSGEIYNPTGTVTEVATCPISE